MVRLIMYIFAAPLAAARARSTSASRKENRGKHRLFGPSGGRSRFLGSSPSYCYYSCSVKDVVSTGAAPFAAVKSARGGSAAAHAAANRWLEL
jgi:hypothetical protein